jgi:Spy/CpxP family protein refolding chaperone
VSARRQIGWAIFGVALVAMLATTGLAAQRGGGGGGGGQGGGGGRGPAPTRMAIFTAAFTLDENQKKQVKTILDDGYKGAAALRESLTKTRTSLGVAIQTGKSQAAIDEATQTYAVQATAMTQAEVKALAKIVQVLTPEQRANQTAMQSATYIMRGIFFGKKWDMAPDVRFY